MNKQLARLSLTSALVVALAAIAGCGVNAQSQSATTPAAQDAAPVDAVPVEVAQVTQGPLAAAYTATTTLEAEREAQLVGEVGGEITHILVEEGDVVRAGQVLARVERDQAALQLRQQQASTDRMQHDVVRNEELLARHMVSRTAYDQARFGLDTQKAATDLARLTLSKTELRAPYDGVITRRHIKAGQWLSERAVAFDFADFSRLRARLAVPEHVSGLIAPGQAVQFSADAVTGRVFDATVTRISPVVDRATGTVGVTVEIDNRDGALRPGLFVRLAVNYQNIDDATLVPRAAVLSEGAKTHVFVVESGTAHKRDVSLGLEQADQVQVLAGLAPGAAVVTVGHNGLNEGDKVTVVDPATLALTAAR
jgi:membrane fusion protein (multidrug efflux system)